MASGIFESGNDAGRVEFQQELSRWFESRGIISELRSHLRHLMVTALQNRNVGGKPTDRSSPKVHALNLIVGEFLFRHGCHYTLSVFTSEVPSLANFSLEGSLQAGRKRQQKNFFQEEEVEEILNALGMSSRTEEMELLKGKYLEKNNENSLVELFLQTAGEMATKLQVRHNLESFAVEGERILSKVWSSKIVDVLANEKMAAPQIEAVEKAIFRITENEMRGAVEEERKLQLRVLSEREKRIQEKLRKHEEEIFTRLTEAEKDLTIRKDAIDQELSEREKHLTEMAFEWNRKHEEIMRLSKKYRNIEEENTNYKKRAAELEEENESLRKREETQAEKMEDMQKEMNSLVEKLKEVTETNGILTERIQKLTNRETKEVFAHQDNENRVTPRTSVEIPLLWSKNMSFDRDHRDGKEETSPEKKIEASRNKVLVHPERWNITERAKFHLGSGDAESNNPVNYASSDSEEEVSATSSSGGDIIQEVQKKLQALEDESNRLNQNYLECKLKYISADSDSESSTDPKVKSPPNIRSFTPKQTKYSQTNTENTFAKIQKLIVKEKQEHLPAGALTKKAEGEVTQPEMRPPTKRQLQHREFFLKNRQLLQEIEKQKAEDLETSPSALESSVSGSEITESRKEEKSPVLLRPQRPEETPETKKERSSESARKTLAETSNELLRSDVDCLALLEEVRIKSPPLSVRKPLRQQILLSDTEENTKEEEKNGKSTVASPRSCTSGKISVGKTGSEGF